MWLVGFVKTKDELMLERRISRCGAVVEEGAAVVACVVTDALRTIGVRVLGGSNAPPLAELFGAVN